MTRVNITRDNGGPLVDQIVTGIQRQIDERVLRPGTKLPSIRAFADMHAVSRFTVVEAYDRLVGMGYLTSRRGAGFFTKSAARNAASPGHTPDHKRNEEMVWLIRRLLEAQGDVPLAGGPWLPNSWLEEADLRRTLRLLSQRNGVHLLEYGDPFGYLPLREHLAEILLPDIEVAAHPAQILLTHGASQALDLVSRCLLNAGDHVLVDDPGYYNLFGNLRLQGLQLHAVPRNADGPDVDTLERMAAEHKPVLYFTQSVLQNPTSTTMSPHTAFRVLQTAERHGFRVVEDDIFSDLGPSTVPRLAALDQLQRVIYLRSFSKTLSGSIRVGFIACDRQTAQDLVDTKMVTSITSCQFTERLLYEFLAEGHYRKYLARLRERVGAAHASAAAAFDRMGLDVFGNSGTGMFLWARFPHIDDSLALAEIAQREGLMLAPGTVFRPHLEPSPWMRFNVAVCDDPKVQQKIARVAESHRG